MNKADTLLALAAAGLLGYICGLLQREWSAPFWRPIPRTMVARFRDRWWLRLHAADQAAALDEARQFIMPEEDQ